MNKASSLVIVALAITAIGVSGVTASATTKKVNTSSKLAGALSYKKVSSSANFNKNYSKFKLYNHVPNSDYKNIKTISWKKSGLNLKKITKTPIRVNMMASQATQYNWYRFAVSKKTGSKTLKTNYWVYGQALKGVPAH